ncbi:MAG TPA: aldo/keto reductase [Caulobacteraceae bacterium]|jgi:aryl-alcohol dehydrogenase-like predicted oxidoreductase|nr:aldo/keto reductase [Caulobacteraceae bacterium]
MSPRRRLGRTDLNVSPLCFGGNVFGWTANEATSFKLLDRFADSGLNFIDTADAYSRWVPGHQGGESETIIGKWLKRRGGRDQMVIATKVGSDMGAGRRSLSARWIALAVEDSLRRLQTDYIDLYQAHFDDPDTPFEEVLSAFSGLIAAGKVRAIGASNLTAPRLTEALEVSAKTGLPRYECLQPHYNLCERARFEGALENLCIEHGLGVIPYYGLAGGFLTGKYRSKADLSQSPRGAGAAKYLNERGLGILAALDEVAAGHAATPGQIALAWLMARPSITAPIASASNPDQLGELLGSARLELSAGDIEQLDRASAA